MCDRFCPHGGRRLDDEITMKQSIFASFYKIGIIPVLEIDWADRAVPLADALRAGDLPIAEVTLRTDAALASIQNIARDVPEVIVGAGTVTTCEQADSVTRVHNFLSRLGW